MSEIDLVIVLLIGIIIGALKILLSNKKLRRVQKMVTAVTSMVMCFVLLGNSDNKINDALDYVKETKHLDGIVEKINE